MLQRPIEDLVKLIRTAEEVGPRNISLIARLTGIPVETARYIIKVRLPRLGLRFRPIINDGRLGLVKHLMKLEFNYELKSLAPEILDVLAKTAYVTYYATLLPNDGYMVWADVPIEYEGRYRRLLESLTQKGILKSYELYPLDWVWVRSIDIRGIDLTSGEWKIDVTLKQSEYRRERVEIVKPDCEKWIDKVDLLVIKELEKNPLQPFTHMARTLGIKEYILRYHYKEHVIGRGLISRYRVIWSSKESFERGDYVGLALFCQDVDEEVLERMSEIVEATPSSSFEAISEERALYVAIMTIRSSWLVGILRLIRDKLPHNQMSIMFIDPVRRRRYTIPYELFDENAGWMFDEKKIWESLSAVLRG